MKVFFMSTDIRRGTGYARVANKIANYLADMPNVEVISFGFQTDKTAHISDRFVDSRIKFIDVPSFGEDVIVQTLIEETPDVLILYNDILMTQFFIDHIPPEHMPPIKILYIDICFLWQSIDIYDKIKKANFDTIWTFTECWRRHLIDDIGFDANMIDVLPHGVDFERFVDIPQDEAKRIAGFDSDDFLIINMNRNTTRKVLSITITAFLELLKRHNMNPRLKLYLGGEIHSDVGMNCKATIQAECRRLKLDAEQVIQKYIFFSCSPSMLTDDQVNILYNAADVGLNTCSGEGFGLTTLEHLYFNRPQVVTAMPALRETLGQYGCFIEPKVTIQSYEDSRHIGQMMFCDPLDVTDALDYYFNNPNDRPESRKSVKERYSWENVYKVLDKYFRNGSVPATE